ncbi:hypothetical protein [Clostridium tarantellae]|uniref:hypothetical protein n=1 Tax=Clostridium tarantellae TaxID=39493 RepID=UPI001478FCB0|nr:hypothetical protein [Clostridium tarantellae]
MKNNNEILNVILMETINNVFNKQNLSYAEALQQAISNLEKDNNVNLKEFFKLVTS